MNLALDKRTALVCGGSSGLGFGVALALAQEGARVCLVARDPAKLEQAVERIRQAGGDARGIVADLNAPDSLEALIHRVRQAIGDPDILVGNNGGPPPGAAAAFDAQLWRAQFEAILLSTLALASAFLPAMRRRRFGRILMISSTSVVRLRARAPGRCPAPAGWLREALGAWLVTACLETRKMQTLWRYACQSL